MRKLKRFIRKIWSEWKIAARRDEVAEELQHALKSVMPLYLSAGGGMGHDSNYRVSQEGNIIGVLRLVNPYKSRTPPGTDMPFCLEPAGDRIAREWSILHAGHRYGLTPKPLWHTDDALFCEYLPLEPLQRIAEEQPERIWDILAAVAKRLGELHAAGITHMDASLENILGDNSLSSIAFVDFEYSPAHGLPVAVQRVYDHLRVVESVYKYIPDDQRRGFHVWTDVLRLQVDADMRIVDLERLKPALGRVMNDTALMAALSGIFVHFARNDN